MYYCFICRHEKKVTAATHICCGFNKPVCEYHASFCEQEGHSNKLLTPKVVDCLENYHTIKKLSSPKEYYVEDLWRSDIAKCECGYSFGVWYCPYSPDHKCHYSRSYDSCDYCGMPEGRK